MGPATNPQWIYDTPVRSDVEAKLRQLLLKLGSDDKILGIQVCAYKDGEVIIDTAAGMLGTHDPRPVQPDSLFLVFSVTKGITAGMLHWLVDNGKLKLDENIGNIWPEFGTNRKDLIKVHHVLNHTAGLQNAMASIPKEDPLLLADWEECLNRVATSVPESEPGREQLYHPFSFGWLCGGVIEHASGKKFHEVLEEAIVRPLHIEGELYVGIPSGVESRLATLTVDMEDLKLCSANSNQPAEISQALCTLPALFNLLNIRQATIPAANGHCSARALARYYATLVTGGLVPPPHSSSSPPLGSHLHTPDSPPLDPKKGQSKSNKVDAMQETKNEDLKNRDPGNGLFDRMLGIDGSDSTNACISSKDDASKMTDTSTKIFCNPNIHDAFLGVGDYANLVFPNGTFGLGFKRLSSKDGSLTSFGHSGLGGSVGFCDIKHNFAIAVILNKLSFGAVTGKIICLVCSELNIPVPEQFASFDENGPDMQSCQKPIIN